jgi:hypothetical protein
MGNLTWEYNQRFKYVIGKLANPIHEDHQREWFIQGLLPLTQIPLTQQWITTLGESLEHAMKIEVMVGYPGSLWVIRPPDDYNIMQLQGHISSLTDKIQELTIPRESRPQVWCIGFYTEGHTMMECPRLRGAGPPSTTHGTSTNRTIWRSCTSSTTTPFHGLVQYHAFPNHQGNQNNDYCEIFRSHGHPPRHFPILQKYTLSRTQSTVSSVGPLLTPPNNVVLWMLLWTD